MRYFFSLTVPEARNMRKTYFYILDLPPFIVSICYNNTFFFS